MTRVGTFCTTTQTNMDTIQLTVILRKDRRAVCFKECILQTSYPQVFRLTQPCSLPMWIPVTSLELTGLRFISPRTERENFLTLTDYLQAIIQKHLQASNSWKFNSKTLQSTDSVCGHYCLYFALFRSRQVSMSTIVHRFSSNKSRNDFLVKQFIEKRFPLSLPKYRTDIKKQRAIAQHNKHTM